MGALSRRTTVFQGPSVAFVLRDLRCLLTHHFGSSHSHPVDGGRKKSVSAGWHEKLNIAPSRLPTLPPDRRLSHRTAICGGCRRLTSPVSVSSLCVHRSNCFPGKTLRNKPIGKRVTAEMLFSAVFGARRRSQSLNQSKPSSYS